MKSQLPSFDVAALRKLAGDKTFARGEKYHRDGLVDIFAVESGRVLAQVHGNEDYRVELTVSGKRIDGNCTCPAFDDGFCKHLVATALAANAGEGADEVGVIGRIRDHLKGKSVDVLVDMIVALAERDPAVLRELERKTVVTTPKRGDDKTIETRLRKLIDGATRLGGSVGYREADRWAEGVHAALEAVSEIATEHPAIVLRLSRHAVERIEKAILGVDDDGQGTDLLERAADMHLAAATAAPPEPVAFAAELFALEMADGYSTWSGAVERYADVLGAAGLAEYRRLAQQRWDKLPVRSARDRQSFEESNDRGRLKDILDFFADREDDVEARIALRAKDLSRPWDYLQLAEFCLSEKRAEAALQIAEEGLRKFKTESVDERLLLFTIGLLIKQGRQQEADACLHDAFEQDPSTSLYASWRKLSGDSARDRAIAFLESQLDAKRTGRWKYADPAYQLVDILTQEGRFDDAWSLVGRRDIRGDLRWNLAAATEKTHPREVLGVYAERVNELASVGGNNERYQEAVKLVARMAKLQSAEEQKSYIVSLRLRHGRKRNFIKLLG